MEITDAPYAAGTPEHNEWVRNVLIPHQQIRVQLADMVAGRENRLGSAESQGRTVIQGGPFDDFDEDGNVITGGILAEYVQRMQDQIMSSIRPALSMLSTAMSNARNSFTLFFEEFQGMAAYGVVTPDKGQLDLGVKREPREIVAKALDPLEPARNPEPKPLWADAIVPGVEGVQAKLAELGRRSHGPLRGVHGRP